MKAGNRRCLDAASKIAFDLKYSQYTAGSAQGLEEILELIETYMHGSIYGQRMEVMVSTIIGN